MTYSLFVKPLLVLASSVAFLSAVYFLPEYWPDHAMAHEAIRHNDVAALARYLRRGLAPEDRAQWRSFLRRTLGRTTPVGVGNSHPDLGAADDSLLDVALVRCQATSAARLLVDSGADVAARDSGGWTLLGRAAGCGDPALVSAMLDRGADAEASEPDGGTVLWEPTNLGWRPRPFEPTTVSMLERHGASQPERPPVRR